MLMEVKGMIRLLGLMCIVRVGLLSFAGFFERGEMGCVLLCCLVLTEILTPQVLDGSFL